VLKRIAEEQGLAMEFTPLYRGYSWSATLTRA
jgi:S-adenosylmethionine-diacylgycerolhomoserine-N-methlytransferase